jgi:hypothetical protein
VGTLTSLTDDVVGSGSRGGIGEGPGKYGGTGLIGLAAGTGGSGTSAGCSDDNSMDEREGLDAGTDSGRGTSPADILEEIGEMSEGELMVGRSSRGEGGSTGPIMIPGGSGIDSGVTRTASTGSLAG